MIRIFRGSSESQWAYLRELVKGVVFLGTPHRGSEWANRLYFLLLGPSIFWPGSKFVPLLRKGNSSLLATIAEQFNNGWGRRQILTVREGQGIGVLGKVRYSQKCKDSLTYLQIVKPQDARTNCDGEICIDVPYNHRRIAKIEEQREEVYQRLVRFINDLFQSQEGIPQDPGSPQAPQADVENPVPQIQTLTLSQTGSSLEEPHQYPWRRLHLKAFYGRIQSQIVGQNANWETLEENFEDNIDSSAPALERAKKFSSGIFSFCYPGHESTIVILTVPSRRRASEADWTIRSPNSAYHPGKHFGSIKIPDDFPFKAPRAKWESPLLSAYVNSYGSICLYDDFWSPIQASLYQILQSLASIVILGPELNTADTSLLPSLVPGTFGTITHTLVRQQKDSPEEDWMIRVTNLFSRAYNRMDDEEDLHMSDGGIDDQETQVPIIENDKETSILAIKDMEEHFGQGQEYVETMKSRGLLDARQDFERVQTQRQLLERERVWVDGISAALGNIAHHR